MNKKENRGGILTNEQVEKELQNTGASEKEGQGYRGIQDTGDQTVRSLGTQVQQEDGRPPDTVEDEP